MSRKHKHRADNRPVTRRYVRNVVQVAKAEIIAAMFHATPVEPRMVPTTLDWREADSDMARWAKIKGERIERAVNG